jgi:hypothetical protein
MSASVVLLFTFRVTSTNTVLTSDLFFAYFAWPLGSGVCGAAVLFNARWAHTDTGYIHTAEWVLAYLAIGRSLVRERRCAV